MKKKLYVLTGFLGSGKTSLLTHLLNSMQDEPIGIIQNEFGKISIDGLRLERDGLVMTQLSRGSIFCSCLKLSFVQALAEMAQQAPRYVFVESSGLADPSNLEEILEATRLLAGDAYELCGVICLVDAVNFLEQLRDAPTVDRQLAHCNMAVITKSDLVADDQLEAVISAVKGVNPICPIITCVKGQIPMDFLQQDLMKNQWAPCQDSLNTPENKPKTITLEFEGNLPRQVFLDILEDIIPYCHRIKGFFQLDEGWVQVDVVERLIELVPAPPQPISQLVFLSKSGPAVIGAVDKGWKAHTELTAKLKNG